MKAWREKNENMKIKNGSSKIKTWNHEDQKNEKKEWKHEN